MEALESAVRIFNPVMVDIPVSYSELRWERRLGIRPSKHLAIVDAAHARGVKVLASKVATNAYLDALYSRGVKAFMSRTPEVQLDYIIDNGWHH